MESQAKFRVAFSGTLLAVAMLAPARAQVGAESGSYSEPGRFTVRGLRLNGQGSSLVLPGGGRVSAQVDLWHQCPSCGGAVNQVIIGLAGEARAQACVWSGGQSSGGWQTVRFPLTVPSTPGRYEVRARYAQAWNCGGALDWWLTDRPTGPDASATIGVIDVPAPLRAPAPITTGRSVQELRDEIQGRLLWIEQEAAKLGQYSSPSVLQNLGAQMQAQVQLVRQLEEELMVAARRDRGGQVYVPPPPPPPAPPPVAVWPMAADVFNDLVARLARESFDRNRLNRLRDAIRDGAHFSAAQALTVLDELDFAGAKVQGAVLMCGAMAEAGALPRLIDAMPFDSNRDQLRRQTGGRCGP